MLVINIEENLFVCPFTPLASPMQQPWVAAAAGAGRVAASLRRVSWARVRHRSLSQEMSSGL